MIMFVHIKIVCARETQKLTSWLLLVMNLEFLLKDRVACFIGFIE